MKDHTAVLCNMFIRVVKRIFHWIQVGGTAIAELTLDIGGWVKKQWRHQTHKQKEKDLQIELKTATALLEYLPDQYRNTRQNAILLYNGKVAEALATVTAAKHALLAELNRADVEYATQKLQREFEIKQAQANLAAHTAVTPIITVDQKLAALEEMKAFGENISV